MTVTNCATIRPFCCNGRIVAVQGSSLSRLWALAALATGAIVLGHLIPLGGGSYIGQALRDSLHGPAFFLFAAILYRLAVSRLNAAGAALFTAAAVLVAAPAGEFAQMLSGTRFSPGDIGRDLLGGAGAILFLLAVYGRREGRIGARRARALTAGGCLLLIAVVAPVVWWIWTLAARAAAAPVIADFESAWQNALVTAGERVAAPPDWPAEGDYVLRVATPAWKYAGVQLREPYPHWEGFSELRFTAATADGENHRLRFRIHDQAHDYRFADRFNRDFPIGPQPREFCIPLSEVEDAPDNRQMDMSAIADMNFFLMNTTGSEVFLLDEIRLSRSSGRPCPDSSAPADPAPP